MKIKTADLIGPALDWAVDKAEGRNGLLGCYFPSSNWTQDDPIIERSQHSV